MTGNSKSERDRVLDALDGGGEGDLSSAEREELAVFQGVLRAARSLDEDPSPRLLDDVLREARKAEVASWWRRLFANPGLGIAFAGAAALVIAVVAMPTLHEQPSQLSPHLDRMPTEAQLREAPAAPATPPVAQAAPEPSPERLPSSPSSEFDSILPHKAKERAQRDSLALDRRENLPSPGKKAPAGPARSGDSATDAFVAGAGRASAKAESVEERGRFDEGAPAADDGVPRPTGAASGVASGEVSAAAPEAEAPPPVMAPAAKPRPAEPPRDLAPGAVSKTAKGGSESQKKATHDPELEPDSGDVLAIERAARVRADAFRVARQLDQARTTLLEARIKTRNRPSYARLTMQLAALELEAGRRPAAQTYAQEAVRTGDPATRAEAERFLSRLAGTPP
ncbi:MAG: hypothetical protein HY791_18725 [Deltaproteobacteria bacterium]|nr:hypothetical protein [Deltaproteobacteria bacterium]